MVLSWEREIQLFLEGREGGRADSWYGAAEPQRALEIQTARVREPGGGSGRWFGFPGREGHQLHSSGKEGLRKE